MSAPTTARPATPETESAHIASVETVTVFNCSRLGLRANPPRRRLLELLFPTWRR
jgi:hypothetical protein